VSVDAARRRAEVELPDGRRGFLMYWPAKSRVKSKGSKARVVLETGAFLSVPVDDVRVVDCVGVPEMQAGD